MGGDLDLRDHRIDARTGPNGAGKTTAFTLLIKFPQPSSGGITGLLRVINFAHGALYMLGACFAGLMGAHLGIG